MSSTRSYFPKFLRIGSVLRTYAASWARQAVFASRNDSTCGKRKGKLRRFMKTCVRAANHVLHLPSNVQSRRPGAPAFEVHAGRKPKTLRIETSGPHLYNCFRSARSWIPSFHGETTCVLHLLHWFQWRPDRVQELHREHFRPITAACYRSKDQH